MECPICYENNKCIVLNCKHNICNNCYTKWCEKYHSCPMCRRVVITNKYPDPLIKEIYFLTGGKYSIV